MNASPKQSSLMTPPLPTPRQLLSSLIDSIAAIPPPPSPTASENHHHINSSSSSNKNNPPPARNALAHVPPAQRPLFTALHALFPALLLPALDLLDRGLVGRLGLDPAAVYRVRPAQPRHRDAADRAYVVRLAAWHCTCAAFAVAAFAGDGGTAAAAQVLLPPAAFGGVAADDDDAAPPCCKHLLACLLADRWAAALGRYVDATVAGRDEVAGLLAAV